MQYWILQIHDNTDMTLTSERQMIDHLREHTILISGISELDVNQSGVHRTLNGPICCFYISSIFVITYLKIL